MIVFFEAVGRIVRHIKKRLPTAEEVDAFLVLAETFLNRAIALLAGHGYVSWDAHSTWIGAACLLGLVLTVYILATGRAES